MHLVFDATAPRVERIWELRRVMTAYDAAYAAAAEVLAVPLVTADDRLRHACDQAGISAIHLGDVSTRVLLEGADRGGG